MTNPTPAKEQRTTLPIPTVLFALGDYKRWRILEHIVTSGEGQMVKDLAEIVGVSPAACSKQIGVLRKCGIVIRGKGGLYHIAPAIRPAAGEFTLDFGFLTARFSPKGK